MSRRFCSTARIHSSDSFRPVGLVIVLSFLVNLISTDLFNYSLHRGMAEAEAFFAVTLPLYAMERMTRAHFYEEAITPASMWLVCNWWAPMPGTTGTGWKWRNRRWTTAANWAVRQGELFIFWGIVLFRPQMLGSAASMCPLEGWVMSGAGAAGAAATSPQPPPPFFPPSLELGASDGAPPGSATPPLSPRAVLLRFWACSGCCRGPVVFREGALFALFLFAGSAVTAAIHFKRQYRYLDSLPDDAQGPGRGGWALRDPATGDFRSFRPLAGEELERYRRLAEYPQAELGDLESVWAFYWWVLTTQCCCARGAGRGGGGESAGAAAAAAPAPAELGKKGEALPGGHHHARNSNSIAAVAAAAAARGEAA